MQIPRQSKDKVPRVSELPLLGSVLAISKNSLEFVKKVARECGDVGEFHIGPITGYLFNTPGALQEVLVDKADFFDKGLFALHAYHTIQNKPVLIREGEEHRQERDALDPIFQSHNLAVYTEIMAEYTEQAQLDWVDGQVIDIQAEMFNLTLRLMGKLLFGLNNLKQDDELAGALLEVADFLTRGVKTPFVLPLFIPTPGNRRAKEAIAVLQRRFADFNRNTANNRGDAKFTDLFSRLHLAGAANGQQLDETRIRDDAVEMFNAGCANMSVGLAWCFYLLLTNPADMKKVQQELDEVLKGKRATYQDLARLPYTLQVFKETLRLYPPVYLVLPRRALATLTIGGHKIKKGRLILVSPYTMHHREEFFPDAESFKPGRFSPENEKQIEEYTYIPFNAGTHDCLGRHFVLLEARMILIGLLQRIEFELVPDQRVEPEASFVLRQANGCKVIVRRREAVSSAGEEVKA